MEKLTKVINFSGGRTSALMTILNYEKGDIVLFQDTGREHPATYEFIRRFETEENIPITWIKWGALDLPFDSYLKHRNYSTIPNMQKRTCTTELKIRTAKRYLKNKGILKFKNLIGFRYDEQDRILKRKQEFKKVVDIFPLNEPMYTKEYVNEYWKNKKYTLEIPPILGNCTCCFMKGQSAILAILREFPELAEPWIKDEKEFKKRHGVKKGGTYFKGITFEQLRNLAQNNLFKDIDLNEIKPAFNCSCTG